MILAACVLTAAPAFAQMAPSPSSPSARDYTGDRGESARNFDSGMQGRARGEGGFRKHGWRGMEEGCKYITIRQRHGDELITRHLKRCD
jgi:hypothetical protein